MDVKFSEFEDILVRSQNELGTCVLLVLSWIAACDGFVDKSEARKLTQIADDAKNGHRVQPLLAIVERRDIAALQLACEVLARHFKGEKANLFLELAIGMVIADGYMLAPENHILRFLADLLGVNRQKLNQLFIDVTGRDLPQPTNPGSAQYWRAREQQSRNSSGSNQNSNSENQSKDDNRGSHSVPDKMVQAFAVLGLTKDATKDEIRKAYRRLAQIHHPDRFSALGEEAVATATSTFQRINKAYEQLVKNA